jgi:flagellar hook-length control protein FliK
MQINTMAFPLGGGTQSASAIGGTGLGFADALGFALGDGVQPVSLKASATPPEHLLARMQAVQAQLLVQPQSVPASGVLPGLQQSTSMAELMATAAKLPGADALPAAAIPIALDAPIAVESALDGAALETAIAPVSAAPEIVTPAPVAAGTGGSAPVAAPLPAATELATSARAPLATVAAASTGSGEPQPEGDILQEAPTAATTAETTPAKPQKGARRQAVAADADLAPSPGAKQAIPAEMLAVNAIAQPVAAQPQQPMMRDASANAPGGSTVSKTSKVPSAVVPTHDGSQNALGTTTADFARAVAAKGESAGSDASPDGHPQPDIMLPATGRTDAAAPAMPQPVQNTTSVETARAAAPAAPAEPVIETRTGQLGQSLGVEIARKIELGEETLRIRLNPIELGRIEVTLNFDDKGSLQAIVRTESAQAMDLLRQDAPELARTLDQAGVRTDAQSFRFENRGGDTGGQQAQQQHQQNQRGRFAASDDAAGTAEPNYRPIRSDGQVDLLA